MLHKEDIETVESLKEENAFLQWENLHLKVALAEVKRDYKQVCGDNLKFAAALREVPKFMSMYVERP